MRYQASHVTRYTYQESVTTCQNEVRLTPRPGATQEVISTEITVEPETVISPGQLDYFGNQVHRFAVLEPHTTLAVTATSIVDVWAAPRVEPASTPPWEQIRDHLRVYPDRMAREACEFVAASPFVTPSAELAAYALVSFQPGRPLLDAVIDFSHRIHDEFTYMPSSTTIDTPVREVFAARRGVCQDFAHVMIAALRSIGVAARYVSGYLRSGGGLSGAEASHAWVSVFLPPSTWIDVDPTNRMVTDDGHITLAWGRDYGDVTPVKGVILGGRRHNVSVEVKVSPLEAP